MSIWELFSFFVQYSTHSKNLILSLFRENPSSSFTPHDVEERLPSVPKSSVYRIVDSLERDGLLRKTGVGTSRSVYYQISDRDSCPRHMHIRCTSCGRTIHMDEETSKEIETLLEQKLGFSSCYSSVLSGKCSDCMDKENKK